MSQNSSTPPHLITRGSEARLPYMPGLDGLRAIAVIAVLLFHAELPVQGGFFGVEAFFVLSGFLITALLNAEWASHRRIDVPGFWLRRARRLLPALLLTLLGTVVIAAVVLRGERVGLGNDLLASLGYVMNWHLILSGQSYFDPLVRPSLLQHLWSLAVEEQFYLLWPLVFVAGMRVLRRKNLGLLVLMAALGSATLMAWLYRPGADPSRIYYGTDTRAGGVLAGAALALLWTPGSAPGDGRRGLRWALDLSGLMALAALLLCFIAVPARHPLLYRGGFALVDVVTVLLIVAVVHPDARLAPRLLGWGPLRWIGLRSYGLYLWHWPVFMVTRPFLDLPLAGFPLLALRLAIVVALVELSYRFVELPVRHGTIWRSWRAWQPGLAQLPMPSPFRQATRRLGLLLPFGVLPVFGIAALHDEIPQRVARPSVARTDGIADVVEPTASADRALTPSPVAVELMRLPEVDVAPQPTTAQVPASTVEASAAAPVPTPTATVIQPFDPALAEQLQALLNDVVASGESPGAVLSVSIPGYEPWNGASGYANLATGTPMGPDTLIHISSITKMFTAVVVLQLAEESKIELDAPINSYLPDILPLGNRTTVRHLLSHRSGVFDYLEDSRFFLEAYQNPERTYTPAELVGMTANFGAAFEPGIADGWKYSSTNYVILGMLVEQVTGRTMAEEMRARIFEPLGLTHTFFAPYEPIEGRVAQGYIGASDRTDVSMTFVFATGNIIATADDLRVFTDSLFSGRLLNAASLEMMTTLIDTGGGYDMPELEYGLGLMFARLSVEAGPDGEERPPELSTVLGHIGGIAGSRAAVWWVTSSGITISLGLNQANNDPNVLARDTLEVILDWQGL